MLKPKKPRRRRTLGEMAQDVKANMKRRKQSRRVKRALKDSAPKASKDVSTRREDRRIKLEEASTEKKWGRNDYSMEERQDAETVGIGIKKRYGLVPTGRAKRAKRTLNRMDKQDKRRLRRKVK